MGKRFLVGVADYKMFVGETLWAVGKAALDTSISFETSSTEVNGGKRNALQYIYYHSGRVNVTINDSEWSLPLLGANSGGDINVGADIGYEEEVTLSGGVGTVTKTPAVRDDGTVAKCWYTYNDNHYVADFSGDEFTATSSVPSDATVSVYYYTNSTSAKIVEIPSNFIPKVVRLELDCDIASNSSGDGIVGRALITIPAVQLAGSQTISMASDGYSNTEITGMALESNGSYCKIIQDIFNTNWYDDVREIAITSSEEISVGVSEQIVVYGFWNGYSQQLTTEQLDDITFTSSDDAVLTVNSTGVIEGISAGDANITAEITEKTSVADIQPITVTS